MAAPDDMLVGLALLLLAGGLAAIGLAGLMERLPRNRWIGLRVAGIREDDAAWRTAHRAAGPSLMAAAGPPLLMGVALIAAPPDTLPDPLLFLALVGIVTGGLLALGVRGAKAAVSGAPGSRDERSA